MTRLVFVKLGGSLITNKTVANSYHRSAVAAVGTVLRQGLEDDPNLRLLIGHGSGSFGHVAAEKHGTMQGVHSPEDWRGFAEVASVAADLNHLVTETLREQGLAIWHIQPSASALSRNSQLVSMALEPVKAAIDHRLTPLVYGDVSLDEVLGGTIISTEAIFFYLAQHLPADQILLLGDVEGVYDEQRIIIPEISPERMNQVERALGGSAGTDVTGGMAAKVRQMVSLVQAQPRLSIRIMGGDPEHIAEALGGSTDYGTLIHAD